MTNVKNETFRYWPGFRPGSFERKPNTNNETKKVTTVYTKILRVNIILTFSIL